MSIRKHIIILGLALALLVAFVFYPQPVHASTAGTDLPIPGWLEDIIDGLKASLVQLLQDLLKGVGVVLWAVLKLCGAVGLLGAQFSALFGEVIIEAINAVIGGSIRTAIRGSLGLSLALLGLSLLARPFWPDLQIVKFQRALLWGAVIQAYLLNAPAIYETLEAFRVELADEIASAVSGGDVPGCGGDTVQTILCIAGTTPAEVLDPSLQALPDTLPPYGGAETVQQLYSHCAYNPPVYYGDPACDPGDPQGDPWAVMGYAQDALGTQFLSLVLGALVLAYGVLQLALGLAAGMMFVLFPVAAIFAFYTPLEGFPAGVVRNYLSIFLKSIVLLTLAAVVIRLFTVAAGGPSGGSLLSLAAVGVVSLLLCGIMAKEALASLLTSVSFVGNSVSSLGAGFGLGGGGGASASYATPESRMAAMMIGGGPVAQALMGAPNPYLLGMGQGGGLLGVPGSTARSAGSGLGAALQSGGARQALAAALTSGGGVGLAAGAAALGAKAVAGSARQVLFPPRAEPALEVEMPARGASGGSRPLVPVPPGQASPGDAPAAGAGQRTLPAREVGRGFARAVKGMGRAGFDAALRDQLGADSAGVFGGRAEPARQVARRMQQAGLANDGGRQLVEAVHHDLGRDPDLTAAAFRDRRLARMPQWDRVTGDPEITDRIVDDLAALGPPQAATVPEVPAPERSAPSPPGPLPEPDPGLAEELRAWRQATAQRIDKRAFHVLTDAALEGIAAARPQTLEELEAVKGIGPRKLELYGQEILDITQQKPEETDA